mgnify:CR=1 FL=1
MHTPLSVLTLKQTVPTIKTMKCIKQFLNYAVIQEPAVLTYHKSDMVLAVHSNAGYLNETKARSRAGGHFFMSSNTEDP